MAGADPKLDLLKTIPLFATCGTGDLQRVAQLVDEVEIPDGKVLMRQGETGTQMFIVATGLARAERDGRHLTDFGPGSVFGEMSIIAEGPRTATVTAVEPMRAFVVGHREFHTLMDAYPGFKMRVLEGLATKIRRLEENAVH